MVVDLAPQTATRIRRQVDAGRYASDDEVVQAAMRLLEEQERSQEVLRGKLAVGFAQADRGEGALLTPELYEQIKQNAAKKTLAGHEPDPDVRG